jgi:hypothetical protein
MKTHPQCFSEEDIKKVQMNGQFFNRW